MLFPEDTSQSKTPSSAYLVFARKYRPQNFQELIGQNHLVDILTNAFTHNRVAHAYMLTGVRGVGKTTTARIIAKGLNCLSEDKPTITPCNKCANCTSITAGKNIDVFEMDAASRTGIDDIREIIDSIPYKPLNGRYKVYIIDEVHMLSKQAFNGLLKTLEEPPAHVKFIFATTEIHKILPTILSRCQKIDLKRVNIETLTDFLGTILEKENITYDLPAIAKIARASEGSVRDSLSLLDQAVAASLNHIDTQIVSQMLGVVEGDEILDVISSCLAYKPNDALKIFQDLYDKGFDCHLFLKEVLKTTEWLIQVQHDQTRTNDPSLNQSYIDKTLQIISDADIYLLSRVWDITLKAIQDIKIAPNPKAVCEITLIRINYGVSLPDPAMMIEKIHPKISHNMQTQSSKEGLTTQDVEKKNIISPPKPHNISGNITNIDMLFACLSKNRYLDVITFLQIKSVIHHFEVGTIEISAAKNYNITSKDIIYLQKVLKELTQQKWHINLKNTTLETSNNIDNKSMFEKKQDHRQSLVNEIQDDEYVKIILDKFPNAKIEQVIELN